MRSPDNSFGGGPWSLLLFRAFRSFFTKSDTPGSLRILHPVEFTSIYAAAVLRSSAGTKCALDMLVALLRERYTRKSASAPQPMCSARSPVPVCLIFTGTKEAGNSTYSYYLLCQATAL